MYNQERRNHIPFSKPFIIGKELYYIAKAVLSGSLSGDGVFTRKCQDWLENSLGCNKALLTHSCTAALEMAAILCNIEPGDEVIMPSFTFVSTANSVVLRGGKPVFVDIRSDTLNIDESLIEDAITEKTKAIFVVHYAGIACDMDRIMDIANKHNLLVVEDAAQALLSKYKDTTLGTIGHLGCISFHETKNVVSGEGGALLINHKKLEERAEVIWEKGTNRKQYFRGEVDKYTWMDIGSSYLPSELVSAFLYSQLENATQINSSRQKSCALYRFFLQPLVDAGKIRISSREAWETANGHIFYLVTKSLTERNELIENLKTHGIYGAFHYVPLHSSPAGMQYGRYVGPMSVTNKISDTLLRLPLFYELEPDQIKQVCHAIIDFYSNN